jgi:PAS domain S-box-containing protein
MEEKNINILLIEDNQDDAELLQRKLAKSANGRFKVIPANSLKDGLEKLAADKPDLVLSDLGLPDSHGLDTVTKVLQMAPDIPLVVLSGYDNEEVAIKAVQLGAQDYLVKGKLDSTQMERSLFYAIERSRLQRELEQYTRTVSRIQTNLMKILEKNADAIIVVGENRQILFVNPAAEALFRCHKETLLNTSFKYPVEGGKTSEIDIVHSKKEKTVAQMRVVDIDWEGQPAYLASLRDITEQKKAQDALRESEESLKKYLEGAPDGIFISDTKGNLVYLNKKAEEIGGFHRDEMVGTNFMNNNLVSSRHLPKAGKMLARSITGKPTGPDDFLLNRKDGTNFWVEITSTPIKQEGKVLVIGFVRDITQRRRTEKALRESEEKFSKAFRSSPDMIAITTVKEGIFIDINDSFIEAAGYTREEVIGHNGSDFGIWVNPDDRMHMIQLLEERSEVKQEEFEFRMKSGKKRLWLFSAEKIRIQNEDCVISIAIDITEKEKMVRVLRFSDAAFKSIHESVIATDNKYKITHWNDISEQIYGIKASEAMGKKLLDTIEIVEKYPGENNDQITKMENTGYLQAEQLHRTKHGEVWVDASFQAIDEDGIRHGWVILATAITQRKLAEEALKRSEEKYRELINTSIDGIVSMDQNMRIIIWNQGAEKIFGYQEKDILGKSVLILAPPESRNAAQGILSQILQGQENTGDSHIMEQELLRKDGTTVPVEMSLSVKEVEGNTLVTGIFRDITERREAEEKLREIDRMKQEFLSNVSHELRTPLQSIGGFARLILEGKVPDVATQQEFLEIIDRESQHLNVLINGLLDMSRLESGRFQINKRTIPVRNTFIESLQIFHSLARDKNVSLLEEIPPELPEMEIDGERLRQVIVNLLSNAIKFSDPGGKVTARVKARDNELLFQVKDKGIGMEKKDMEHLFERFYRAEDKLARGGTGLGLFISKQIIEAHGGQIWAESKVGEGSTFSFTLPLNGKGGNGNGQKNTGNRRRSSHVKAS